MVRGGSARLTKGSSIGSFVRDFVGSYELKESNTIWTYQVGRSRSTREGTKGPGRCRHVAIHPLLRHREYWQYTRNSRCQILGKTSYSCCSKRGQKYFLRGASRARQHHSVLYGSLWSHRDQETPAPRKLTTWSEAVLRGAPRARQQHWFFCKGLRGLI